MENIAIDKVADVRQAREYGTFLEKIGWKVQRIENVQVFIRKIGPVAIGKVQRVKLPVPWKQINKAFKKERVIMSILEPVNYDDEIKTQGFKLDRGAMIGNKTLIMNIHKPEGEILERLNKDTRYTLRKTQKMNLKFAIDDYEAFYKIWRESAKRKGLWIPKKKDFEALVTAFGEKCFCVTTSGKAGALILIHQQTAYYYYAGATAQGTKENLPYAVAWKGIIEAKKRSCKLWNWEGIFDERWPNKSWVGFTRFKKNFGGEEVKYPGTFVRWSWPI